MRSTKFQRLAIAVFLCLMCACGGGGTDVSGVGGTGGPVYGDNGTGGTGTPAANVQSTGTITGFGSIFVNGVEFFTTSAQILMDNESTIEGDLKLGMVVTIKGEIDANNTTGTAAIVESGYESKGVIQATPVADALNMSKTFSILGKSIIVDRNATVFHSQPGGTPFTFDTISKDQYVCLNGFTKSDGTIKATYIEDLGPYSRTLSEIIVKGVVSGYNGGNLFSIDSNVIEIESRTTILAPDTSPGEIKNGITVSVYGVYERNSTRIQATKIAIKDTAAATAEKWIIEGVITNLDTNAKTFNLEDQLVDYSALDIQTLGFNLANDLHVEVTGANISNILVADSIRNRSSDIEIHGLVTNKDQQARTLTMGVIPGQQITVALDERTLVEGASGNIDTIVASIQVGDFAEIRGSSSAQDSITASYITTEPFMPDAKFMIAGAIDSINKNSSEITVFNTTFTVADTTNIEGNTPAGFFSLINPGDNVIIWDNRVNGLIFGDGIADTIEMMN